MIEIDPNWHPVHLEGSGVSSYKFRQNPQMLAPGGAIA